MIPQNHFTGKGAFSLTAFQNTGFFDTKKWLFRLNKVFWAFFETHELSPGKKCKIHPCTEPQLKMGFSGDILFRTHNQV